MHPRRQSCFCSRSCGFISQLITCHYVGVPHYLSFVSSFEVQRPLAGETNLVPNPQYDSGLGSWGLSRPVSSPVKGTGGSKGSLQSLVVPPI